MKVEKGRKEETKRQTESEKSDIIEIEPKALERQRETFLIEANKVTENRKRLLNARYYTAASAHFGVQ